MSISVDSVSQYHSVSTSADLLQQGARLCPAFQIVRNPSKAYHVRYLELQKRCGQLPGTWVNGQQRHRDQRLKSNKESESALGQEDTKVCFALFCHVLQEEICSA